MSTLDGGRTVGRYRIERFLGAGAMGEVYLAEDPHIGRPLAIKTVRLVGRPQEMEDRSRRLLREARAAGRLLHPHIVTLFDAGEVEGVLYLAFEYVEGADLAARMTAAPPLTLSDVLRIVREAAEALDYAHRQGIVHRDIKPSNILIDTTGRVKVADFGIAKMAGQSTELTVAGSVMGSPQYLSPEQIRGEDLDGRSDLFSLGVVLYELLSGRRPFDGETLTTLVYQILHKEPPPVSELRGGVPPRLEALLAAMLAKDHDARPATAGDVADEIAAIERELPDETLAGPAATDAQKIIPTRALPRRTTANIPAPPLPPVPQPAAAGPAAPAPAAPARDPAARTRLVVLAGLVMVLLMLVAAAGAGWWVFSRRGGDDAGVLAPTSTEAGLADPGAANPEVSPADPGSAPGAGDRDPGMSAPGSSAPAATPPGSAPAAPPATPPRDAQPSEPARDPAQAGGTVSGERSSRSVDPSASGVPPHAPEVRPVPREPARDADPARTRPGAQLPVPAPERPVPPPVAEEEEAPAPEPAPLAERVAADQRIQTGLALNFRVTPADSHVLVDGRVIGRAEEWSGQKGARTYTLPDPGEYLIKIRKPGLREHRIAVDARETAGTTPVVVRLQPLPAADVDTSDLPTYRVREAIAFRGAPDDAEILVDGRSAGKARQFTGGRLGGGDWLTLSEGRHRVSVVAPGYGRRDFAVEVLAGAEKERERIDVRMSAGGGR